MTPVTPSLSGGPAAADLEADALLAAVERLAGLVADAGVWPAPDRRGLLRRLDRALDCLGTVRAAVLLAERESGAWKGAGDRSFEAWRGRTSGAEHRAATAQVRQAEHLGAVPSVTAAATTGQITLAHAAVIGRVAATGSPAQQAAMTSPAAQAHLIALAKGQDAGTFATTVARLVATVDPDALERDHQAQRGARFLQLADTPRGTVIKGQVDTMAGRRLRQALEAVCPRPGAEDDRDPGQRRADALDTLATRILSDTDTTPGAHVPPHVSLILTEATWHAARTERDRRRAARVGAGAGGRPDSAPPGDAPNARTAASAPPAPASHTATGAAPAPAAPGTTAPGPSMAVGYEPATLEDGTPVPASELARVLCDCDVTCIAIGADGAPLDLGRTQRLFSGPQRRAVIARDRECIWPDCHVPARWCEIHHCDWWDRDGGHTRVDRGVLLCAFHHHEAHRRDLTITRDTVPPGSHRARGEPAGTLACVRYELRDPTGRVIGRPPPATATVGELRSASLEPGVEPAPGCGASPSRGTRPAPRPPGAAGPPTGGPSGAAGATGREPPDQLDLEWVTDPVTGMNVPAFLLGLPR